MITRSSKNILSPAPNTKGQGWRDPDRDGGRKRKRSGTHNAQNSKARPETSTRMEPCAISTPPAPKVLCRWPENVSQGCYDVPLEDWSPRPTGWLEPTPYDTAPVPGQSSRPVPLRGAEETGHCQDHGSSSTFCPRATKRPRKAARLEKLYFKGPLLGKGGYGSVYAGTRKTDGMPVAIKYVSKAQADEELDIPGQGGSLPLEVALMKQVNMAPQCPYVLRMLEWFDQPTRYVMVLERPEPCQDLVAFCQDHGGLITEGLARQVMVQLLRALDHCRERGVLHRDVKPENMLIQIDSHRVKLFDFGCGDLLKYTAYKDYAGTLEYTPPEWFLQRQYLAGPTTVWSVGITLFTLVCGLLPFTTIRETIKGRVHFSRSVSPECRHLIRWCLSAKPKDRPTLEQIQLHPWLL
ncbi:serine/threonine-protein kinase pim-1-like [Hypomesus transpacificus]|uniref:serine/threonine-protein kinase pim-1-like n=1 Tax=Hypomesus transpacificus TaxID=137520 RepID=UPI001F0808AE|nr:serine/threonine-protein kinase pim-1-like [Hypomesus transpacificus]